MQKPLGAQISHALKARGVEVIFGIPGVHNVEMYRGIEEAGITHVLARHEQGAGFMADGYARASGRPGVCYLITGPGFVNAMTALGQAYSDSVPVLALASCLDEVAARRGQLHQMRDQRAAGATVCDWSETASDPTAVFALIDRAFGEFASARPRPKALHVPIAALGALADPAPEPPLRPEVPHLTHDQIYAVIDALTEAEKPLFVFGGGAAAGAEYVPALLQQTGAASFVTYAGRGIVPADQPLFFGSFLARPDSARIAAEADLVVALGTELSEVDLWRDRLGNTGRTIRVDLDPEVLSGLRAGDMGFVGDAAALMKALTIAIPARNDDRTACWDAGRVAETRRRWRGEIMAERPGIVEVAETLRAAMPDDAMIYSDMTQLAYGGKEVWDMPRAGHWHHPSGFGTLGYALPAAIGGAVARKGLPTCAIMGDYGLQYTLPELGTAVELGLPLPILVWDNGSLGEIRDSMVASQIAPNAVVARNPDFLALARAYGAGSVEPSDLEGLQAALVEAFQAEGPTVIRMTPALV
ncbi:putative 2-ketoarginine decarboxylase AruI [Antarctobacter heliothermus]|uniref:Putative 2-ketoarginine decarboxylase AruI n=1 Tax=Antarctobacter heliothermus TaxID=74033 RepID=A0A222E9C0_9RHOB|nr:5-guanidino-2-oxopentanoate decarboxylase [Antarctobacter heliothermus]ASP22795.1 putative 2-ketoarginine decarboxylase AruI [Antarctobacter heliothermus]